MSCFCIGGGDVKDEVPPIMDIEQVLQNYVWNSFVESNNIIRRLCLRRRDFNVSVPMNYFHFETLHQHVDPRIPPETGTFGHLLDTKNRNGSATNITSDGIKSKIAKGAYERPNVVEIVTNFENDTDLEQTFRFRLEKTRKAILNVSFQKGFTIGGKANFSLGLPKLTSDSKFSADTEMTITVTDQHGQNIEDTVVLETTSDIKVKERSKYVAKVLLAENRVSYNFTVLCRMSMPLGEAQASITRKKDGELFYSIFLKRLDKIFKGSDGHITINTVPSALPTKNYVVDIKTTGIVEGVRLTDQKIVLESTDLPVRKVTGSKSDRVTSEKSKINVDYVSQQPISYHCTSSSLPRPLSIDGPIIEEVVEDDEDDGCGSGARILSSQTQPNVMAGRASPLPLGIVSTIVPASPSSVGSSPLSEKSGSDVSGSIKTSTTV